MSAQHPIIDVQRLGKIYGENTVPTIALTDISFSINRGEFVAIMGPSGSGKSTLLHILGLLDGPTSGKYLFDGTSVATRTDEELAAIRNEQVGFIFQAFNLLGRTTVLDNVKLPLVYSRIAQKEWNERAEKAIAAVGLLDRISHEPSELSGGEKQRVAIARALVTDPDIIFADEPTGNLDSKSGEIIMDTIDTLNEKEGKTIILITHESYAASYAKRLITLKDGSLETDGPITKRRDRHSHYIK